MEPGPAVIPKWRDEETETISCPELNQVCPSRSGDIWPLRVGEALGGAEANKIRGLAQLALSRCSTSSCT